jgi:hypothetical protein
LPFDRIGNPVAATQGRRKGQTQGRHRLRVLALLRVRRLSVLLLRRLADRLPAGDRRVDRLVGRHLPQPERRSSDYLISYNDCCGKSLPAAAASATPTTASGPATRMGIHNDINWCMTNSSNSYHCTVAAVVGTAEKS